LVVLRVSRLKRLSLGLDDRLVVKEWAEANEAELDKAASKKLILRE
jgi:hypothetical protein